MGRWYLALCFDELMAAVLAMITGRKDCQRTASSRFMEDSRKPPSQVIMDTHIDDKNRIKELESRVASLERHSYYARLNWLPIFILFCLVFHLWAIIYDEHSAWFYSP